MKNIQRLQSNNGHQPGPRARSSCAGNHHVKMTNPHLAPQRSKRLSQAWKSIEKSKQVRESELFVEQCGPYHSYRSYNQLCCEMLPGVSTRKCLGYRGVCSFWFKRTWTPPVKKKLDASAHKQKLQLGRQVEELPCPLEETGKERKTTTTGKKQPTTNKNQLFPINPAILFAVSPTFCSKTFNHECFRLHLHTC